MRWLAVFAALLLVVPAVAPAQEQAQDQADDLAALHDRLLVIDTHIDVLDNFMQGDQDAALETSGQFDLPKLAVGRMDAAALALFTAKERDSEDNLRLARDQMAAKLAAVQAMLDAYPERIALARSPEDVRRLAAEGRHAAMLSILNASFLGEDLSRLDPYLDAGLMMLGMVHRGHNDLADSSRPKTEWGEPAVRHGGLSPLGRQLIGKLNAAGVVVDVSQLSPAALREAIAVSRAPVIASHSAVKARVDHPRNLTDGEIIAIAESGGVVQVAVFSIYLKPTDPGMFQEFLAIARDFELPRIADAANVLSPERFAEFEARYAQMEADYPPASVDDLAAAIRHIVDLVGIDHVGIGSDFNHGGGITGYNHVGEAAGVTEALLRAGFDEAEIAKIWGENFLRVWAEAQTVADTE